MRPVAQVFFVIKAEYPKLQAACPGDFPFTYAQFVKRVDDGIASLGDSVRAVKLEVVVADFIGWCAQSNRTPDNLARAEYAQQIAYRQSQN